jgi:hypothetical protein
MQLMILYTLVAVMQHLTACMYIFKHATDGIIHVTYDDGLVAVMQHLTACMYIFKHATDGIIHVTYDDGLVAVMQRLNILIHATHILLMMMTWWQLCNG